MMKYDESLIKVLYTNIYLFFYIFRFHKKKLKIINKTIILKKIMKLTDNVIRAFKPAKIFRDNTDKINHIDYTSNGETLITSSDDDSITLYDCFDGK